MAQSIFIVPMTCNDIVEVEANGNNSGTNTVRTLQCFSGHCVQSFQTAPCSENRNDTLAICSCSGGLRVFHLGERNAQLVCRRSAAFSGRMSCRSA